MQPNQEEGKNTTEMQFPSYHNKEQSQLQSKEVGEAKGKLDNLILQLNDKLVNHFKSKQEALLNQYKQELIEQQRTLNDLKNTTNQQQIRNKMIQRKSQLERQRNHLIQTNMFFSQKCQQYKQTYAKLVQESNDLQRELKFLDQQMQSATTKRLALVDEAEPNQQTIMFTAEKKKNKNEDSIQKSEQISTMEKTKKSSSLKKIGNSLTVNKVKSRDQMLLNLKNKKKVDTKILQKSALQKLFEDSVEEVRERRKLKRAIPSINGEQFTEFEKKAIMQIFLSNEEVKRKIYYLIFSESERSKDRFTSNEKVKISFEELGI